MMIKPKPLVFAHRGVSSLCPENTLAAFQQAIEVGADGIELDVHRTKDGKLVVIHDETVDRTTDGKGIVAEMLWDELSLLDAGAWFEESFRGQKIPLLEEVLELLQGTRLGLNIELKTDYFFYPGIEGQVYDLIRRYRMEARVILSSFNHHTVVRFKQIAPEIQTGILYSCHLYEPQRYGASLGVNALHPPMHLVDPYILSAAKEAQLKVHAWLPRESYDEKAARAYLNSGVDILITNYPHRYLALA